MHLPYPMPKWVPLDEPVDREASIEEDAVTKFHYLDDNDIHREVWLLTSFDGVNWWAYAPHLMTFVTMRILRSDDDGRCRVLIDPKKEPPQ